MRYITFQRSESCIAKKRLQINETDSRSFSLWSIFTLSKSSLPSSNRRNIQSITRGTVLEALSMIPFTSMDAVRPSSIKPLMYIGPEDIFGTKGCLASNFGAYEIVGFGISFTNEAQTISGSQDMLLHNHWAKSQMKSAMIENSGAAGLDPKGKWELNKEKSSYTQHCRRLMSNSTSNLRYAESMSCFAIPIPIFG